ncbi:hypothetical protein ACHAWX_004565 [Stephanocyclus meneghinianus]
MLAISDHQLNQALTTKVIRSFWLIGVLNNAPWVLMLACAPSISSGGVALVFLSNQIPGLIVKISAPYWFHDVSYKTRMLVASISMGLACILVGFGGLIRNEISGVTNDSGKDGLSGIALELIGVSFISFQCSLGEASALALAGKFDSLILPSLNPSSQYSVLSDLNSTNGCCEEEYKENYRDGGDDESYGDVIEDSHQEKVKQMNYCITAFSSGTGLAGIFGYGYKYLLSELLGWGLSSVVFSVVLFAVCYYAIFYHGLHELEEQELDTSSQANAEGYVLGHQNTPRIHMLESSLLATARYNEFGETNNVEMISRLEKNASQTIVDPSRPQQPQLTSRERFNLVLSLWLYTIPLFTVYAAEYMLQAGVWSAIGFPVTSATARAQFYHYSNWSYQLGVFVSRSSGNLFSVSLSVLWLMPMLQVGNLVFFLLNSVHHFWYNYSLLLPCFFAGLLGGGVYVQAYSRLNLDFPVDLREFAIASAGVADSLGILVADVASLFIQSCIYDRNGIEGAAVKCLTS